MSAYLIMDNYEDRSADLIIEILNNKNDNFNNFIENNIIKKEDKNYGEYEFVYTAMMQTYVSPVNGKNFKFVVHIQKNKGKSFGHFAVYDHIFHYMECMDLKSVILSMDQFEKYAIDKEFDILEFCYAMVNMSFLSNLDIGIVVENVSLKEKIISLIEKEETNDMEYAGSDILLSNTAVYGNEIDDKLVDYTLLNKYLEENCQKRLFRKKLIEYIAKTGETNEEIAKRAFINKGTLSAIINGKEVITRSCALSLGIVFGLNLSEYIEFMETAGYVFPNVGEDADAKRDLIIMYFLENDIKRDIFIVNDILDKKNYKILGQEERD